SEFIMSYERMAESEKRVFQVMMGGAVGTFSSMPEIGIEVQKRVAELVGMYPMAVPSRNINSHKVEYMMNLSLLANICHKIAEDIVAHSQTLYSRPSTRMYSAVRPYDGDSSSYMLFDGLLEESLQLITEVLLRTEELTRTLVVHEDRMLHNALRNRGLANSEY